MTSDPGRVEVDPAAATALAVGLGGIGRQLGEVRHELEQLLAQLDVALGDDPGAQRFGGGFAARAATMVTSVVALETHSRAHAARVGDGARRLEDTDVDLAGRFDERGLG